MEVLSSSEVRASDLEHGGSWVRIPSVAQIYEISNLLIIFTLAIVRSDRFHVRRSRKGCPKQFSFHTDQILFKTLQGNCLYIVLPCTQEKGIEIYL